MNLQYKNRFDSINSSYSSLHIVFPSYYIWRVHIKHEMCMEKTHNIDKSMLRKREKKKFVSELIRLTKQIVAELEGIQISPHAPSCPQPEQ